MAETPQLPNSSAAPLPAARIEDEHIPAVSSPLNPDAAASRTRTREQREKKAVVSPKVDASPNLTDIVMQTLKKRELADGETQGPSKKAKKPVKDPSVLSPIRYRLPSPKPTDYDPPKAPTLILASEKAGMPFYETTEHVFNRKSFRYTNAIVDPAFPSSQYHRSSETEPFGPRIDFKDAGSHVVFDNQMMAVSTEKGFRMARANVGAREGRYYWECRILSGIKADPLDSEANGHVRVGWSRREGSLEGPVGYDPYSYGIRDVAGEKVHMSRPKAFANADFCEGDVMGLEIMLPSLALHRKVVDGVYNKAVDVADDLDLASSNDYMDIIRDRVPIRYKTQLYFEQFEYAPTKPVEDYMNPAPAILATATPAHTDPPSPNHPEPSLRTLPFSSIKIYKNGELVGTPFTDLLAFLPPASKPLAQSGARDVDDGTLGYYPSVSVFRGGAAETNFGPRFWFPPPELGEDVEMADSSDTRMNPTTRKHIAGSQSQLRPISDRFNEQIAEDVTIDILDEIDFWEQDGGEANTVLEAPEALAGTGDAGIKEIATILQDDE